MTPQDERETPPELFAALNERFGFTLDACATDSNAKCDTYCVAPHGLTHDWTGWRVWCNPPYSELPRWVEKAHTSVDVPLIVMLVPATRTEQAWWQDYIEPHRDLPEPGRRLRVEFLRGRTRFVKDGQRMGSPKFGCCLLVWGR